MDSDSASAIVSTACSFKLVPDVPVMASSDEDDSFVMKLRHRPVTAISTLAPLQLHLFSLCDSINGTLWNVAPEHCFLVDYAHAAGFDSPHAVFLPRCHWRSPCGGSEAHLPLHAKRSFSLLSGFPSLYLTLNTPSSKLIDITRNRPISPVDFTCGPMHGQAS